MLAGANITVYSDVVVDIAETEALYFDFGLIREAGLSLFIYC